MGAFPCSLWSQEFSLPGSWVLVLANSQGMVLPLRPPIDVVGGRGVGVVWYFRAAGGALVWVPFCCLLVFWFVLLFTSTLHERVTCSHIQQETET